MARYNIQQVTNGDWDYADDSYDFKRIADMLLFDHLRLPDTLIVSDTTERYYAEDEWQSCHNAPDDFMFNDDAPSYIIHALQKESTSWEVLDSGRLKTMKQPLVHCISAEAGEEEIWMEVHGVGKCPYLLYYKDVVQDKIFKLDLTLYIKAIGDNMDGIMEQSIREGLERAMHEDAIHDCIQDIYEYDHDKNFEHFSMRVHRNNFSTVRRMP